MLNKYIGCDVLEIPRLQNKINKSNVFLKKAFTKVELEYVQEKKKNKYASLAGIFSAKESLIKCFSKITNQTLGIKDFEITHKNKIPYVNILNNKLKKYEDQVDISISHTNTLVFTVAILNTNN